VTQGFVAWIIGKSNSNHLGAQGTFEECDLMCCNHYHLNYLVCHEPVEVLAGLVRVEKRALGQEIKWRYFCFVLTEVR